MSRNKKIGIYLTIEFILFTGIILFLLFNLGADSALNISTGQELSTDPPQYTSFARNMILFGQWDVFSTRYKLFVNNITTLIAYLVFKMFGIGRAQSNLVAAIISFVTIYISFIIWKMKDYRLAITALAILGFNCIFLSYGKLPFLEVTTLGVATLGCYFLLVDWNRNISAMLAGCIFASAAFFSKLLAIIFFPIALIILFIETYQMQIRYILRKANPLYAFLVGYIALFSVWYIFFYLPNRGEVGGYLSEISTGMYGAPKAFESIKMFLIQFYSYGFDSRLWSNQFITFATGFLGVATIGGKLLAPTKDFLKKVDRTELLYFLWFIIAFAVLFPWNYRPLRYALLILPPLAYFAARWILLLMEQPSEWGKRMWPYYLFSFIAGSYVSYHILISWHYQERSMELLSRYMSLGFVFGIIFGVATFLFHKFRLKRVLLLGSIFSAGKIGTIALIFGVLLTQIDKSIYNNFCNQETIHNASLDLGKILSPEAVVVGSYSSALTQDNNLRSAIKMFGVPTIDSEYFERMPATHIAIEAGAGEGSNENRAFKDYPDIMKNSQLIATYYLRGYPVNIYLIALKSTNGVAREYKASLYELAVILANSGKVDSSMIILTKFERQHPNTISAAMLKLKMSQSKNDLQNSITYLKEILSYDKKNYNILAMLGEVYLRCKPPKLREAFDVFREAIRINPDNKALAYQINLLRKYLE